MAATDLNELNSTEWKTDTGTEKSTFTLVTLQSFSVLGDISA